MEFPEWYQSSEGPQLSKTLFNLAGNFLPVINFMLASKGINILPETVNLWITLGVFVYFSVQAGIGYIRAKKVMAAKIGALRAQVEQVGGVPAA